MAKGVAKPKRLSEEQLASRSRPLTVFLTVEERAAVVKRLRRIDADRRVALLRALGVGAG